MLENYLVSKNYSLKVKITVKTIVSLIIIVLTLVLPQITHAFFGSRGGILLLPMYLPIILGGCLLGFRYGLVLGVISPLISFGFTSIFQNPMPALNRLPFMMVELMVIGFVSGLFSNKINKNKNYAFVAVITSLLVGRLAFLISIAIFGNLVNLPLTLIVSQIETGLVGLTIQSLFLPFIIVFINYLLNKSKENE